MRPSKTGRTDVLGNPVYSHEERLQNGLEASKKVRQMILQNLYDGIAFRDMEMKEGLEYLKDVEGIEGELANKLWLKAFRKWKDKRDRDEAVGLQESMGFNSPFGFGRDHQDTFDKMKSLFGKKEKKPQKTAADVVAQLIRNGCVQRDYVVKCLEDAGFDDDEIQDAVRGSNVLREFDEEKWKHFRDRSEDHLTKDHLKKGFNRRGLGGYFTHEVPEIIDQIRSGSLDVADMEADDLVMEAMRRAGKVKKDDPTKIDWEKKNFIQKMFEEKEVSDDLYSEYHREKLVDGFIRLRELESPKLKFWDESLKNQVKDGTKSVDDAVQLMITMGYKPDEVKVFLRSLKESGIEVGDRLREGYLSDMAVSFGQKIPLAGSLRKKRDRFARDYWTKNYPEEATKFYAEEDEKARLKKRDELEARYPYKKKERERREIADVKMKQCEAEGHTTFKSIMSWFEDVASQDAEFMEMFATKKSMLKMVSDFLVERGQASSQMRTRYQNGLSKPKEKPTTADKAKEKLTKKVLEETRRMSAGEKLAKHFAQVEAKRKHDEKMFQEKYPTLAGMEKKKSLMDEFEELQTKWRLEDESERFRRGE